MLHVLALILATPSPSPAYRRPDCFHAAMVIRRSDAVPIGAVASPAHAVAQVDVSLDATGRVVAVHVVHSSGQVAYDAGALRAARTSTYLPKTVNCDAEPGDVLFMAEYYPPGCFRDVKTLRVSTPEGSPGRYFVRSSVLVFLHIDATGKVTSAEVTQSSGDLFTDQAALHAAEATTYAPKIVRCEPVAGTYTFRSDFR